MIDLENFPTRQTAVDMMSMISPIYDKAYVAKWIFEVMSAPLSLAQDTVDDLKNQAFPETATWTLPYWEQSYGIATNEALSIEERRIRIIRKRNFRKPMNPARIELLLEEISGREVKLVENVAPSTFRIEILNGESKLDIAEIIEALSDAKQSQKSVQINVSQNLRIDTYYGIRVETIPNLVIQCERLNYVPIKEYVGIRHAAVEKIILA